MVADSRFLRTRTDDQTFRNRLVPVGHLSVAATSSGTADTLYTVPDGKAFELEKMVVVNTDTGAVKITIHAIPEGDSIGDANLEVLEYSIASKTTENLTSIMCGFWEAGTVIKVYADTASKLHVHGYGKEWQ